MAGWRRNLLASAVVVLCTGACPAVAETKSLLLFDFEGSPQEWAVPDWEKISRDYVCQGLSVSDAAASHGKESLQLLGDFPGAGRWAAVYAEREIRVTDWSAFGALAADVYLPANAPRGLTARIILTVGEQWQWTEQNRPVELAPGQWTTLTVHLQANSMDWKFFPDETFRKDVRKLGVRIESNKEPTYSGPVFIDCVRLLAD